MLASIAFAGFHFHHTKSLQQSDIILFIAGIVTLSIGMVAELVVRQRQTNDRELEYWRRVYHEADGPS